MIVVGFWKFLGVYFLYTCDFCILGLTIMQSLCCRIFEKKKSKGVILIKKVKKFYNSCFPNTVSAVLTS